MFQYLPLHTLRLSFGVVGSLPTASLYSESSHGLPRSEVLWSAAERVIVWFPGAPPIEVLSCMQCSA